MPKRHWKRLRPTNFSHAMELCLEHAKAVHNRSVDRIADLMGLANKWIIYKWIESGRIPGILIRPFEHACGIDYVTRYLAHSDHKLIIDIPTGRNIDHTGIHTLQSKLHDAVGALITFYRDQSNAEETLAAITGVMEDLAWHRGNVEKFSQPELDLEDTES